MNDQRTLEQIIKMLTQLIGKLEAEAFEQEGFSELSMRQLLYLETIARMGQPTFSELADQLKVTKPSITNLVGKLIGMGYVKKVQSNEDRRVYRIEMAPKGEQFTEMHANMHRLIAHKLTENLSATETGQLVTVLQKVLNG